MATTAKGTPYVESSDLVANYPAVSLALAEHIDDIGKILQVVRATDTTSRSTTSTSFVDVTGMSVTITPQKSTSAVLLVAAFVGTFTSGSAGDRVARFQVTDSSNNTISGTESSPVTGNSITSIGVPVTLVGYATPGTTSATTYKMRFNVFSGSTANVRNDLSTGQLYAIEVSA